jgi:transcription factor E
MLQKFLKDAISSVVGKPADEMVDLLDGKKYTNEFLIAKKLDLTINQTRNILYKVSDFGLVSFIRKKDKRKGWYTYFWKIEIIKCLEFLKSTIQKKMEQIQFQIKSRETKEFYTCEPCNIEFTEESALVHNFVCNECGSIVTRKDNAPVIKEYMKELDKLNRELALVDADLKVEKEKTEKTKARFLKKEEAKKKAARVRTKKPAVAKPAKKKEPAKKVKETKTKKIKKVSKKK